MKTFTGNRTPSEAFNAIRAQYGSIQKRLDERMAARAAEFATKQSPGYDLVADEARILRYLALALAVSGDRSAVDELGIEY